MSTGTTGAGSGPKGTSQAIKPVATPLANQSCWQRNGKFAVVTALAITALAGIAIGSYLHHDQIFSNMGIDVAIGAGMGLVVLAIALIARNQWNKRSEKNSEKSKSAAVSEAVLATDATKASPVIQPSKLRYLGYTIAAIGALLALAAIAYLGGYCGIGHALIGHDTKPLLDALAKMKEYLVVFYQHTFQPLGEYIKEGFGVVQHYFEQNGMSVGYGALYTGVALPMLATGAIKTYHFLFPKDNDVNDTEDTPSGSGANSGASSPVPGANDGNPKPADDDYDAMIGSGELRVPAHIGLGNSAGRAGSLNSTPVQRTRPRSNSNPGQRTMGPFGSLSSPSVTITIPSGSASAAASAAGIPIGTESLRFYDQTGDSVVGDRSGTDEKS
jgi:hypothetical protein